MRVDRVPRGLIAALVVVAAVASDVVLQRVLPAAEAVTAVHEWPAEASGPVWVVVDPPNEGGRMLTLRWGPWRQRVYVAEDEAVALALTKAATARSGAVGISVTVDPAADLSFGVGPPPAGLPVVDLDGGWGRAGRLP